MCLKCCVCCTVFVLVLAFIIFIGAIAIVPLVFKYSADVQTNLVFPTGILTNTNFNPERYLIKGVKNLHVLVDDKDNITLGVWQILPQDVLNEFTRNSEYDYANLLKNEENVVIYLHGNGMDRTEAIPMYLTLRQYFHILAVDYRGYGDSSKGTLTETTVVGDLYNFYLWLRNRTNGNIFVWGHSLGSGVGTHLLSNLKDNNVSAEGLILEAPFTSIPDAVDLHPLSKIFSWLPWYEWSMLHPFIDNDVAFPSKKYISNIDCPIMIIHAQDDDIIPYVLSDQLYNISMTNRDFSKQGNVTYHLLPSKGYSHMNIYDAAELPNFIEKFLNSSTDFKHQLESTTRGI